MAFGTATLTGTYRTFDDQPAEGVVEIIPNSRSLIDAEGDVILAGRVKVTLDAAGSFTVTLPATDDATVEPATGRQYTVVAKLRHTHLPAVTGVELATGATVDVADVASVPVVDPLVSTAATVAQLDALEADLTTALAGKADTSAVPTTPDDIGAEPAGLSEATEAALATTFAAVFTPEAYGAVGDGVADDSAALAAAYAALVANGRGVLALTGDYRQTATLVFDQNVPCLVQGNRGALRPDPGVTSIRLTVGKQWIHPTVLQGVLIDGAAASDAAVGVEVNDHYGATLRDCAIRNCGTGVLITDTTDWSESSTFDGLFIDTCAVGIDLQTTGGTGSFGYAAWGRVSIDNVPEGGIGLRVGPGAYFWNSDVANLIIHVGGAAATGILVEGDLSRNILLHGIVEGAPSVTPTARYGLDIAATGDVDGLGLTMSFAGTWTQDIGNPSSKPFQYRSLRLKDTYVRTNSEEAARYWVHGETFPRMWVRPGHLLFGSGSSASPDVSLYRAGGDQLRIEDKFSALRSATTEDTWACLVSGDSQDRWRIRADGRMWWGSGSASADVNLFRRTTDQLATEDSFFLGNQASPPATPTNGGVLYVEGGALKYKGSSGTVTTIAPA